MKKEFTPRNLVAIHLFNDHSGSPLVLAQWLQHTIDQGTSVEIHTSRTSGKLDAVRDAKRVDFNYSPANHKWLTLIRFMLIQCVLFIRMLRLEKEGTVVYVNTILPFGAILGAKLAGIPVVCHVHEVSVRPRALNAFLCWVARRWTDRLVFVSEYVAQNAGMPHPHASIVPNSLSETFLAGIAPVEKREEDPFRVLMLASPRIYKGIYSFVAVAKQLPNLQFELVLNGGEAEVMRCFAGMELPDNLEIWPAQSNVHPFYQRAELVLNLSLPDQWVETFGMTALEAMAYGIPVIVPPVGGIAEVVENGVSGFHVDAYQVETLVEQIKWLESDPGLYSKIRNGALARSRDYHHAEFARQIDAVVGSLMRDSIPKLGQEVPLGIGEA